MARKRYTAEQIIGHLRRAEVLVGQGRGMEEVLRRVADPFALPPLRSLRHTADFLLLDP